MTRRLATALALLALALFPSALAEAPRTFFAMDTAMSVSAPTADAALLDACEREIYRLEALFSVTDPDSEIARLNAEGSAALSPDTERVLRFALETAEITGGALDVTLYPVVRAWGFTTGEYRVPADAEIAALLENVDWRQVSLSEAAAALPEGVMADLGALAKGYASDRLVEILTEGGVDSALIDLGGNIWCVGEKPDGSAWRIGIRDPLDPASVVGSLSVRGAAVITSGSYERCFVADDGAVYGHIFDPMTGRPAESGLISVTVTGASGLQCDALSTALYVMGAERAAALLPDLDGVEAVLVDSGGALWVTSGLKDSFTPMYAYQTAEIHWIG